MKIVFSWPMLLMTLSAAGLGWWCAGLARRYARLLHQGGDCFDGADLLWQAVCLPGSAQAQKPADAAAFADAVGNRLVRSSEPGQVACTSVAPRGLSVACAVLMAGLAWVLTARWGGSLLCVATLVALALLLVSAIVDAQTSLLPDALTLPLLWLGLGAGVLQGPQVLQAAVLGAMVGYVFPYGLFKAFQLLRKRDGMGHGDFKLLAALGAWVGVQNVLYVLLAACLAGLLFAVPHCKKMGLATAYPFGPFLAVSGAAVLVFLPEVHSYF